MNLATSIDKLQPHEAVDLRGYEFDEYGVLGGPRAPKSLGTVVAGTHVLSAHLFMGTGSTTQIIVHLDDGSLRYSTDFLTTSTTATWTTIATGLSTSAPFSYVTFLQAVWMTNGTNDFRKWDGTTSTTYASAPKGTTVALWRDTLWIGGIPSTPWRVQQSAAGDPTTWPAANFVDVEKGSGHGISALYAVESALIIFRIFKTHIIFDPVEYTNRVIDASKGCLSQFAVVAHNGLIYFMSHLGICRYLGDGPSQIVSEKIAPLFDDLYVYGSALATGVSDFANWYQIASGYSFQNYVGWFIPSVAVSEHVKYFPDLPDKPWIFGSPEIDPTSTHRKVFVSVRPHDKPPQLYRFSGDPVVLFREYGGVVTDGVNCTWRSAWFDFDSPMDEKYIDQMQIFFRGILSTVVVNRDWDPTAYKTIASALTQTPELRDSPIFTDLYVRSLQLEVSSTASAERRQIMGAGLANEVEISRFQSAIGGVQLTFKVLGKMRR